MALHSWAPGSLLLSSSSASAAVAAAACAALLLLSRPLFRRQLRVFSMAACTVIDYKGTKTYLSWRKWLLQRLGLKKQPQPKDTSSDHHHQQQKQQQQSDAQGEADLPGAAEERKGEEAEEDEDDAVWSRVHERNAERVFRAIVSMEGLWVKAGQYLSTRSDVMPEAYINHFKLLQDTLPPRPLKEVYEAIEKELGAPPSRLFQSFDPSPLGTASIAQVHRAVSVEGEDVVVKVQHKGVKQRILQDLRNMRTIVRWVAWLEPDYNFAPVVDEWAKEVPKELDFRVEAQNMKEVTRNLCGHHSLGDAALPECPRCGKLVQDRVASGGSEERGGIEAAMGGKREALGLGAVGASCAGGLPGGARFKCPCGYEFSSARDRFDVDVELPQVRRAMEKVLVMTFMDGVRLNDEVALRSLGVDTQKLLEDITRAYAHQIYVDGLFNADPHPGNFLVSRALPHRPILLDFGLTKRIDQNMREALAKMLLATAKADPAMLLSAFEQMGLKLRVDVPDDAMLVTSFFFRRAAPPKEALAESRQHIAAMQKRAQEQREREAEVEEGATQGGAQAEGNQNQGKPMRRNPVDAFPGELVFFIRVLNLLRGLSSLLGGRVAYLDIMKPFAEAVLSSRERPEETPETWFRAPASSLEPLRSKLQKLLWGYHLHGKVLGIQVCAYKGGEVVLDAAAGYLGEYDPRPVQHDSLFPVFSATKGVTAAMVHWLALEKRCLSLDSPVASLWPEFGTNGKERTTVAHVLTHRAGLENALASDFAEQPMLICNWEEAKRRLAAHAPSAAPGDKEAYHYLTYGWLAGGIVESAARRSFQQVLHDAFADPLGLHGEFYVGIPPGVETRLASLCFEEGANPEAILRGTGAATSTSSSSSTASAEKDASRRSVTSFPATGSVGGREMRAPAGESNADGEAEEPSTSSSAGSETSAPGGFAPSQVAVAAKLPLVFNSLFVRRAVIPSANGHFSARALARFYACLADHGAVPAPPHPTASSQPPLGTVLPPRKDESTDGSRQSRHWAVVGLLLGALATAAAVAGRFLSSIWGSRKKLKADSDGFYEGGQRLVDAEGSEVPLLPEEDKSKKALGVGTPLGQPNSSNDDTSQRIFSHPNAVDAFLGIGDYAHLADGQSTFGLGFIRYTTQPLKAETMSAEEATARLQQVEKENPGMAKKIKEVMAQRGSKPGQTPLTPQPVAGQKLSGKCAFGHAGLGGSVAFCDPNHSFAVAVLINQLCFDREVVGAVVRLVCTELGVPVPAQFKLRDAGTASADAWVAPSSRST